MPGMFQQGGDRGVSSSVSCIDTAATVFARSNREVTFATGDVLGRLDSPIPALLQIRSGLASVVVDLPSAEQIEAAMIGPGGVLGVAAIFGFQKWTHTIIAQSDGAASLIRIRDALSSVRDDRELHFAL